MIRLCLVMQLILLTFDLASAAERPNVLFIAVDDLRPELACYGRRHIHSPNIDRLAASGVLFERAYCMVPTCGASRASLMTGVRPSRRRFVNYLAWAQKDAPGKTTFNTQFQRKGYFTVSLGKIFHHPTDNAKGWSEAAWRPKNIPWYRRPENLQLHSQRQKQGNRKRGPAWESADVPDSAYADGVIAERAIADLQRLGESDKPSYWRSASLSLTCRLSRRRNTGTYTTARRSSCPAIITSRRMHRRNRSIRPANCGLMREFLRRGRCPMKPPAA